MTPELAPGFENKMALTWRADFLAFEAYSPGRALCIFRLQRQSLLEIFHFPLARGLHPD